MTLSITATREITVTSTGLKETQTMRFSPWRTPEAATTQILAAENPGEAYKLWVLGESSDVSENIYAADDPAGEREPVGVNIINVGKQQCEIFDTWIAEVTQRGYTVKFAGLV